MAYALRPARGWQRLQGQDWRRLRLVVASPSRDEICPFLVVRHCQCWGTRPRRRGERLWGCDASGAGAWGGVRRARADKEGLGLVILGLDAVASVVLLEVEQAACTKGTMTMVLE